MGVKSQFFCNECGTVCQKWSGQCAACSAWNTIVEQPKEVPPKNNRFANYSGEQSAAVALDDVPLIEEKKGASGSCELDRVLGGGLVAGSVVLIGGDPGIGKSTLLIQTLSHLSMHMPVLYVSGEESLQQIALRAKRLQIKAKALSLFAETEVSRILNQATKDKPQVMVVDSIQTMYSEAIGAAPGSVSQVRESAALLVRFAKSTQTTLFLVGHVTKDGAIAGPRVLEHMVDTVLYFEGQKDSRFRVIRAIKNRFGAVNELGVFAMTDKGLKEVSNPSSIFLSKMETPLPGSVVMVTWEGTRPLLVEVQALLDDSYGGPPRRVVVGLEHNRLAMLLAVLHRHAKVSTVSKDVFINVVGGIKVTETAVDLALLVAVLSSYKNITIPSDWVIFGEVGLAGEIRPVQSGQERLNEAYKHGFSVAIAPFANAPKDAVGGMTIHAVKNIKEVVDIIFQLCTHDPSLS